MRLSGMPILITALVVALLDAAFAISFYWNVLGASGFTRIFQSIASGFLGKAALAGGGGAVALGAITHFGVALGWTLVYAFLLRRAAPIRELVKTTRGQLVVGLLFGAGIWLFMDFVVMPLSHATPTPPSSWRFYGMLAWHILGVGPPIVLLTERAPARDRAMSLAAG
jgi:hypothetical protein